MSWNPQGDDEGIFLVSIFLLKKLADLLKLIFSSDLLDIIVLQG